MKLILIALLIAAMGCASTKGCEKTKASGEGVAYCRMGVITTTETADGGKVTVCGTEEFPCQEVSSTGGKGSDAAWKGILQMLVTISAVAGLAFGR